MNDLADRPAPAGPPPDVEVRRDAGPADIPEASAMVARRSVVLPVAIAIVLVGLAGGGVWWHHQVTADPGLEFTGGGDLSRDEAGTDRSGITPGDSRRSFDDEPDEVEVAFVPNGALYATVGLSNAGDHDVRVEAARPGAMFSWGFERMGLSSGPGRGSFEPFRPFTLGRGEARLVRLEFRLADCDPASVNPGGYSTLRSLRLRYRILGTTRTAAVPFRDTAISVPAMGNCRGPIVEDGE